MRGILVAKTGRPPALKDLPDPEPGPLAGVPLRTWTNGYGLSDATHALDDLRSGRVQGSAVLKVSAP